MGRTHTLLDSRQPASPSRPGLFAKSERKSRTPISRDRRSVRWQPGTQGRRLPGESAPAQLRRRERPWSSCSKPDFGRGEESSSGECAAPRRSRAGARPDRRPRAGGTLPPRHRRAAAAPALADRSPKAQNQHRTAVGVKFGVALTLGLLLSGCAHHADEAAQPCGACNAGESGRAACEYQPSFTRSSRCSSGC